MGRVVETLTVAEVELMNRRLVETSGGGGVGFMNPGSLEHALDEIQGSLFGQEICPTIHDKAATLCWRIVKGHVFIDGNKRTGLMAAMIFYRLNGFTLTATQEELLSLATKISTGGLSISDLSEFFRQRT